MKTHKSVTFRLPTVRWNEVVAVATREGRTPSGLLRYMVERYLDGAAGVDLRRLADERVRKTMNNGVVIDD